MDVLIREASAVDAPVIAELVTQLGYPSTVEQTADRIARWRKDPLSRVVVATLDDHVVGVLAFHAIPFFERDGRRGRVVSLVVDAEARGHGVGARLMSFIEAEARRLGCEDLELTSSRYRTGAHAFYKHLGFEDACHRSARFVRPLSTPGDVS
ncbi:GNAT family N-acetyltransferase [Actinoallomurus soli]|uniref:GNAT family N-acetyltransferase n=1 Tax=Actinoallomurus soli TaxID=2952535 RepID=UPI0020927A9C|nr:GNAT family N-acetyltransferase [Actinoallomurus soli]MCO5967965.1 GNAT family N-acetyltransferase [Actinoallomurus soli]